MRNRELFNKVVSLLLLGLAVFFYLRTDHVAAGVLACVATVLYLGSEAI